MVGGPLQSRSLGGSTNYSTGVIFLNIITDLIGSHRRLESKRRGNKIHCRTPHLGFSDWSNVKEEQRYKHGIVDWEGSEAKHS